MSSLIKSNVHLYHRWTISDFLNKIQGITQGKMMISSWFDAESDRSTKWQLRLHPNGEDVGSTGRMALYVDNKSMSHIQLNAKVKFIIFNVNGNLYMKGDTIFSKRGNRHGFGFKGFLPLEEVVRPNSGYITDGVFEVLCTVEYSVVTSYILKNNASIKKTASNDLCELYQTMINSDVTFEVEGTQLKAHKLVLLMRIPVFSAMFSNSLKEARNGVVKIEDTDPTVFQVNISVLGICNTNNIINN